MRTLATLLLATLMSSTPRTPSGQPGPMQPSDYTQAGPHNVVSWQLKRLPPPSALYVTADDFVVVSAATSQANEVVTVNVRRLDAHDARPHLEQLVIAPTFNRALVTKSKPLAEGFILSISCQAAIATTRGQTFVRVALGNAALGVNQPVQMLMADYVTTAMAPAHPNGRVLTPAEGPGNVYSVTPANPAPGADWQITVPANARWRVQSGNAFLQTSAAAGNRVPQIQIVQGSARTWLMATPAAIAASTLVEAVVGPGLVASTVFGALVQLPIPQNVILRGSNPSGADFIGTTTSGLLVADQWSNTFLSVEEWLDNI